MFLVPIIRRPKTGDSHGANPLSALEVSEFGWIVNGRQNRRASSVSWRSNGRNSAGAAISVVSTV
jgi:hypothetical protein